MPQDGFKTLSHTTLEGEPKRDVRVMLTRFQYIAILMAAGIPQIELRLNRTMLENGPPTTELEVAARMAAVVTDLAMRGALLG